MRADRLVAALLILQARGRVTAPALARELEVSVKTARRDLEALASAGLPVYAQPGRGGGWSLLGGARTDLSGLTAAEARAMFLLAGPAASVAPDAKAALRKLVRALPETFRAEAQAAASAVVLDTTRWGGTAPPSPPHLDSLQRAVIERRQVRMSYAGRRRRESTRTVHPLGLVHKGQAWYLVAGTDEGQRTFQLARIRSVVVLDDRADRPEGFDLAGTWASTVAAVEEVRRRVRAVVRVPAIALGPLRERWGSDLVVLSQVGNGHARIELAAALPEMIAEQLAGWGKQVEVIGPDEVREHLARIGAELVERYGPRARQTYPPAVKLNADVHVLPLSMAREGQMRTLNVSLIGGRVEGPTLVDAGLPGQMDQIATALREAGFEVGDLKRIIITHQDIDHVGSLHDLVSASGARVLAYETEVPFIDGTEPARFATPAMLDARPELRPVVERMRPTHVDEALRDGSRLELAGGVRAVATPGHTIGHMCLYLERSGTLIAGDALTASDEGRLQGPLPAATPDMTTAAASVRKLAELDVQAIICYHGGVVADDAAGQLRRVAAELS